MRTTFVTAMNGRSSNDPSSSKAAEAAGELQPMAAGSSPSGADDGEDAENSGGYDDIVQTLVEKTSLPGVPRVILARSRLSRYFWIFACLTCAISFGVGIFQLLERYFRYQKKASDFVCI
jgi:Amiloride-sensitive sodium channel